MSPLRVGEVLMGNCGGWFGRDVCGDLRVEALGADWVVARDDAGDAWFAHGAQFNPEFLDEHRSR